MEKKGPSAVFEILAFQTLEHVILSCISAWHHHTAVCLAIVFLLEIWVMKFPKLDMSKALQVFSQEKNI